MLGHVTENHSLHGFIYSFHMPLFFFVSGMLYNPKERYAIKQARTLLWPYLIWALLCFLYWAVIETKFRPIPEDTSIFEQFINIIYPINKRKDALIMNVVLWFLPALYISRICYHYILSKIHSTNIQLMIVGVIALAIQCFDFWLPLCIPQALCALPFFTLGHLLNDRIISTENVTRHTKIII